MHSFRPQLMVCISFALKDGADGWKQKSLDFMQSIIKLKVKESIFILLFLCIFMCSYLCIFCINLISIQLKNISAWGFFCKLAAYFQNSFLQEYLRGFLGILFFDLFIILLLFVIIVHCRSLLFEKVKRFSEAVIRFSLKKLSNNTVNLWECRRVISEKVAC